MGLPSLTELQHISKRLEILEANLEKKAAESEQLLQAIQSLKKEAKRGETSKGKGSNTTVITKYPPIPILVIACNRVSVSKCLDGLFKSRPSAEQFPIIVSQDCIHPETTAVIKGYGDRITFIQQPDQSVIAVPPAHKKYKGYYAIARHYGWALNQTFLHFNHSSVIIVEDDLEVSVDFFEYFLALYPLLRDDPTLYCISAWNDNGKRSVIDESSPDLLYRTEFFPGLGWMLTRSLWMELMTKWPTSFWDDWIRMPEQRQGRACIRPEISRTSTFGKKGVSLGQFFEKHLKFIVLNSQFVPFTQRDLTYLTKDKYDELFVKLVYQTQVVTQYDLLLDKVTFPGSVRITYNSRTSFRTLAHTFKLMDDFKSGVPRTAYRGVVSFFYKGRRVYLSPPSSWNGYESIPEK
ncbi:unnamed protein product [Darwinula stevensoni]|uniref:Alpha-1,3-mannosyl-glycoprotein 2-beta-N-acetylglucosaminyltransferase n=1 Tax=Darwinula stevensoni TaxID=69355 RepID=A0A7R8X891_9CRUS|nr:unnamed protein product [Darwinula stevensoni]CAG0883120.1 unnamed protein product [Darwinula stevensoni]